MRDILFRGKRTDDGEWVYGDIDQYSHDDICIMDREGYLHGIDKKTVGQYIGLVDKNKKKIFEGDVLNQPVCQYVVEFRCGAFFANPIESKNPYFCPHQIAYPGGCFEVIGNIHDNPELIDKQNDDFF